MSTIEQQKQLPSEIWENKPQSPSPFNKPTAQKVIDYKSQLESMRGKSDFFSMSDGEEIEIYFNMNDPRVGVHMTKGKDFTTGEPIQLEKMHFIVWNTKADCEQTWTPSRTTAINALQAMEDYNTNALIVRRKGKDKETKYTFIAPGLKRASDL